MESKWKTCFLTLGAAMVAALVALCFMISEVQKEIRSTRNEILAQQPSDDMLNYMPFILRASRMEGQVYIVETGPHGIVLHNTKTGQFLGAGGAVMKAHGWGNQALRTGDRIKFIATVPRALPALPTVWDFLTVGTEDHAPRQSDN